jgi:gas vesicle protein
MNFWIGLIIGLIIGANIGVVVAGLLASSRRGEQPRDRMQIKFIDESAAMEEDSGSAGSRPGRARSSKSNHTGPRSTP